MTAVKEWRIWQIRAFCPIEKSIFDDLLGNLLIEPQDKNTLCLLAPAEWMQTAELHALLEQDFMDKITVVRGPIIYQEQFAKAKQLMDEILLTSSRVYPEKLYHQFEETCQFLPIEHLQFAFQGIDLNSDDIKSFIVYCDADLNVSRAAEILYIHRNTLLYRLDKLYEITGFNVKRFIESSNLYFAIKKLKS